MLIKKIGKQRAPAGVCPYQGRELNVRSRRNIFSTPVSTLPILRPSKSVNCIQLTLVDIPNQHSMTFTKPRLFFFILFIFCDVIFLKWFVYSIPTRPLMITNRFIVYWVLFYNTKCVPGMK